MFVFSLFDTTICLTFLSHVFSLLCLRGLVEPHGVTFRRLAEVSAGRWPHVEEIVDEVIDGANPEPRHLLRYVRIASLGGVDVLVSVHSDADVSLF